MIPYSFISWLRRRIREDAFKLALTTPQGKIFYDAYVLPTLPDVPGSILDIWFTSPELPGGWKKEREV